MVAIPEGYESLLERPLYGHLATVRPDGNPQVNPMWFAWDGELLRFTHTTKRQKYRNIAANPNVAMSIIDPGQPVPLSRGPRRRRGDRARIRRARSIWSSTTATAAR